MKKKIRITYSECTSVALVIQYVQGHDSITSSLAACLVLWWRRWLRHCATSRKVAGSIPDGVIVIFHRHNPSGRTKVLGSNQPLTEMSTRNISWGLRRSMRRANNLNILMCRMGASTSWNSQGLSRDCFTFLSTLPLLLETFSIPQELARFLTPNDTFILEIFQQISLGTRTKSIEKNVCQPLYTQYLLNSVALVRERTIPTERPPPVGEVSANFCG